MRIASCAFGSGQRCLEEKTFYALETSTWDRKSADKNMFFPSVRRLCMSSGELQQELKSQ